MLRRIAITAAISIISLAGVFSVGCTSTSTSEPYSLTGNSANRERKERLRYTDDKGRYHPELRSAGIPLHEVASN